MQWFPTELLLFTQSKSHAQNFEKLDTKKSYRLNDIRAIVLENCSPELALRLTRLFQFSYKTWIFLDNNSCFECCWSRCFNKHLNVVLITLKVEDETMILDISVGMIKKGPDLKYGLRISFTYQFFSRK